MKLYEFEPFPNPRRARMFFAEKGLEVERVQIDVPAGEHRTDAYRAKNPDMAVPCLELDDGTHISGCVAIGRYLETKFPEPALMGQSAEEQSGVTMWQRRVEEGLMDASTTYFHHATPGLGALELYQNKEWGLRNAERVKATVKMLDTRLATSPYVAGNAFSIADITAFAGLEFALFCDLVSLEGLPHLAAWHSRVSTRPSATA